MKKAAPKKVAPKRKGIIRWGLVDPQDGDLDDFCWEDRDIALREAAKNTFYTKIVRLRVIRF